MKDVGDIKLDKLPLHNIIFVATSDPNYEMNRTIVVENWDDSQEYLVVQGGHCSCYGFDESQWYGTSYTHDELVKVANGWLEGGYGSEARIAHLLLRYLEG